MRLGAIILFLGFVLRPAGPNYLQPPAQASTLQSPEDCLAVFEPAFNWHAKKLYGVACPGPFDEL